MEVIPLCRSLLEQRREYNLTVSGDYIVRVVAVFITSDLAPVGFFLQLLLQFGVSTLLVLDLLVRQRVFVWEVVVIKSKRLGWEVGFCQVQST